jgi:hypothetical protein
MKNILHPLNIKNSRKIRKSWRVIIAAIIALLATAGAVAGLITVNKFFDSHYFIFNPPVVVKFQRPIELKTRKIPEPQVIQIVVNYPGSIDTPIKKYICDTFTTYNCNIALAVANAEGLNHPADGFNINDNGTIDVGIFRINSVHFNRPGCELKNITDAYKNIDCAYSIFKEQGWTPWTSVKNGSYLKFLNK